MILLFTQRRKVELMWPFFVTMPGAYRFISCWNSIHGGTLEVRLAIAYLNELERIANKEKNRRAGILVKCIFLDPSTNLSQKQ